MVSDNQHLEECMKIDPQRLEEIRREIEEDPDSIFHPLMEFVNLVFSEEARLGLIDKSVIETARRNLLKRAGYTGDYGSGVLDSDA